jgi:hypothetical protein
MHHRSIIYLLLFVSLSLPSHGDVEEKSFREQYYDEETGTWNFPPPKSRDQKTEEIEADALNFLEQYSSEAEELDEEVMDRMTRNLREANNINQRVPGPGERVIQPDIAAAMEPLREVIYSMVQSETYLENYHGVRYLTYLAPTDESMNLLYAVGQSESSEASVALHAIFQSGWDTPELRQELVQDLSEFANGESKTAGRALNYGARWNLTEGIPYYAKIFERYYHTEGFLDRASLKQLRQFGDRASDALSVLLPVAEKVISSGSSDEWAVRDLKKTITSLGGVWPEDRTEPEPVVEVATVAEVIEEVTAPEPATEELAEVVVTEPIEGDVEPSSQWWLWLIGAMVAFGGIGWLLRRK